MKRDPAPPMKRARQPATDAVDQSIREKIEQARELFRLHEHRLRSDEGVCGLLESLQEGVEETLRIMKELGVVETCRWCEEEAGGSCCGVGIENRYSSLLLLVNLLLGVRLPQKREKPDSCYFLGTGGCRLKARHALCVNYLCKRLTEALSPDELHFLQGAAGQELDTGFFVYEAVQQIIRS